MNDNNAQQYIELFLESTDILTSSLPVIEQSRKQAFDYLQKEGLPRFKSEDYQRTNIPVILEKDWGINLNHLNFPLRDIKGFMCSLPGTDSGSHCIVNDSYRKDLSRIEHLPEGVFAGSLIEFSQKYPDVFERYYASIAKPDHDGLVALNTMFAQDGFVLYVPKGVMIERPIQIVQLLSSSVPLMAIRRNLVIMEEGSAVKMLACEHTLDDIDFLSLQVFEIFAGTNSDFELVEMEESSAKTNRISSFHLLQKGNSRVTLNGYTLNNGLSRNNYYCKFTEPHAELVLGGLAIGTDKQHIDNYTIIDHNATDCYTNELFKYVLSDTSYGVFSGRILVERDAQKTKAYQSNRNLLLSKTARMHSKPQLEIYADDVKCSHGMTTGQLSDDALFYLRQRGIPLKDARMMLSIAFTEEVINLGHIEGVQERLHKIIEARFRGESLQCSHCNKCGAVIR